MDNQPQILIVDDDEIIRKTLALVFKRAGYQIETAATGQEAINLARQRPFSVALIDIHLPDVRGVGLVAPLKALHPDLAPILITGYASLETAVSALNEGAAGYITKPVNVSEVLAIVGSVLEKQRLVEEKRQAEAALRRYATELQERNEELDAFAHTVAHDLKNLLGMIIGYADILKKGHATMPDDDVSTFLEIISQNGRKMSRVIDALLMLAVAHKQEVQSTPLDMAELVKNAVGRLSDTIKKQQAKIVQPPDDTWPTAIGYGPWVEEVWVNYLNNALKYGGRPPHIQLGFTVQNSTVRFWVSDDGDGVPPEAQQYLFTPFTRLDQKQIQGYGLGLSIVRRIVERLNGQVGVESQGVRGQGSVFSFTLPLPGAVAS